MSDQRRVILRRALASCFASLYVFGAFASLLHVAEVEHVRCAEHGEVIHLEGPLAIAKERLPLFSEARLSSGQRGEAHDEHDHCPVLAPNAQQSATLERGAVLEPSFAARFDAPLALASASSTSAIALYRLAPKHGPPAA